MQVMQENLGKTHIKKVFFWATKKKKKKKKIYDGEGVIWPYWLEP